MVLFHLIQILAFTTHHLRLWDQGDRGCLWRKGCTSFAEFQIPITDRINAQLALRHEDFSDSKSATVENLHSTQANNFLGIFNS